MFLDGTKNHGQTLLSGEQCLAWDFSILGTQSISPSNCKYTTLIDLMNKKKCDMNYGICQTSIMTFVKKISIQINWTLNNALYWPYNIRGKSTWHEFRHMFTLFVYQSYRAMYARVTLMVRMLHCYIRYLVTLTRPARAKVKPTDVARSVSFCFCCRLNQTYSKRNGKDHEPITVYLPTFLQQWRIDSAARQWGSKSLY
jgi:hypothetical protein